MNIKTYFKADTEKIEVREVADGDVPGTDSEGGTIFINRHFPTREKAMAVLRGECAARVSMAARGIRYAEDSLARARDEAAAACQMMAKFTELSGETS